MFDLIPGGRRRLWPALVMAVAAATSAAQGATPASVPRLSNGQPCTQGQATLRTEPLQITTARGRYALSVEMADNDDTRETGLMCRTSVPANGGMLFDFKAPQDVAFWMHNTIVPLDMLFIAQDGRVISIARNAPKENDSPIPSSGAVLAVLELRAGRAAELGVAPGDRVTQRIFRP